MSIYQVKRHLLPVERKKNADICPGHEIEQVLEAGEHSLGGQILPQRHLSPSLGSR